MNVQIAEKPPVDRSHTILRSDDRYHIELCPAAVSTSDALIITFDWANIIMGHEYSRFGVAFLNKSGFDVIHVGKFHNDNYQMLEPAALKAAIDPVLHEYGRVFTYGMSLGGYCALFYSGCLGATAIAFSPRLPGHPSILHIQQSSKRIAVAHPADFSSNISARNHLIVYDPFERVDETFRRSVLRTIPDEAFFPTRFFGHKSGAVLHEIGLLKGMILDFITAGARPDAKVQAGRKRSLYYLRALAIAALERGHPKLGMIAANKLFAGAPTPKNKRLRKRIIAAARAGQPASALHLGHQPPWQPMQLSMVSPTSH